MALGILGNSAVLGLIGSIAGRYLQARSAALAAEAAQRTRDIEGAQKVFDQLSPLLDTRLFLSRAVAATFDKTNVFPKDEVKRRWEAYEEVVVQMDGRVNLTRAELHVHFGSAVLDRYDTEILQAFDKLRMMIMAGRDQQFQSAAFLSQLAALQTIIFNFNAALISQIIQGQVGSHAPSAAPAPASAEPSASPPAG